MVLKVNPKINVYNNCLTFIDRSGLFMNYDTYYAILFSIILYYLKKEKLTIILKPVFATTLLCDDF